MRVSNPFAAVAKGWDRILRVPKGLQRRHGDNELHFLPVAATIASHFWAGNSAVGFAFSDHPMSRLPDHPICAGRLDRKQFLYLPLQNSFYPTLPQTPRKDGAPGMFRTVSSGNDAVPTIKSCNGQSSPFRNIRANHFVRCMFSSLGAK
jgi:hypothetical protein